MGSHIGKQTTLVVLLRAKRRKSRDDPYVFFNQLDRRNAMV
jgi:hypothetical protein